MRSCRLAAVHQGNPTHDEQPCKPEQPGFLQFLRAQGWTSPDPKPGPRGQGTPGENPGHGQHLTSGGRDGQANALRALHKCVVKSGNCGVMALGGVQHAAIGQLEASRCAQLTQAVCGVGW